MKNKYPGWTEADGYYRYFPVLPEDWSSLSDDGAREWGKRAIELDRWMVIDAEDYQIDTSWHIAGTMWKNEVFRQVAARLGKTDEELVRYASRADELTLDELVHRLDPNEPLVEEYEEDVDWVHEGL